jgi:hypothetical protein
MPICPPAATILSSSETATASPNCENGTVRDCPNCVQSSSPAVDGSAVALFRKTRTRSAPRHRRTQPRNLPFGDQKNSHHPLRNRRWSHRSCSIACRKSTVEKTAVRLARRLLDSEKAQSKAMEFAGWKLDLKKGRPKARLKLA